MRDDALRAEIGARIRIARQRKGLTQPQLSELLGTGRVATVSMWEGGKQMPDAPTLRRLAEALGVATDELVGLEPEGRESGYRLALEGVLRLATDALGVATGAEATAERAGSPRPTPADPATAHAHPADAAPPPRARKFEPGEGIENMRAAQAAERARKARGREGPGTEGGRRTSRTGKPSKTGTDEGA